MSERRRGRRDQRRGAAYKAEIDDAPLHLICPSLTRTAAAGLDARGAEDPVSEWVAGLEITQTQLQSFKILHPNGSLLGSR